MATVNVCETFLSIQGESSFAGLPCFFIRLSGCNLRCTYCDTRHAYAPGRDVPVGTLVDECLSSRSVLVEITGGEPLLQEGFRELAGLLRDATGRKVLVETNGSLDISLIPDGVVGVMDVKCPGSGEAGSTDRGNFARLRPFDEVKFVLADRGDYEWARRLVEDEGLVSRCRAVFFSPVYGVLLPRQLGEWMLRDSVPARLQLPLHKLLDMA
jgi:7-carboxy-7-deazaguanine synthase